MTFIPKNIKLASNSRIGTESKTIAFVIMEDKNGKYPLLSSLKQWKQIDSEIVSFSNEPLSGYKVDKENILYHEKNEKDYYKYKDDDDSGFSFNIVVTDPRGFQFEISPVNFSNLAITCNIINQEIMSKCILAWENNILKLIPAN